MSWLQTTTKLKPQAQFEHACHASLIYLYKLEATEGNVAFARYWDRTLRYIFALAAANTDVLATDNADENAFLHAQQMG